MCFGFGGLCFVCTLGLLERVKRMGGGEGEGVDTSNTRQMYSSTFPRLSAPLRMIQYEVAPWQDDLEN